jgi:hypothetical protein
LRRLIFHLLRGQFAVGAKSGAEVKTATARAFLAIVKDNL